ncbi:MAG: PorT family protein, partial [Cytophagales bacterium]|nr:PorT family protein [Cytophaga sp.]
STIGFHVGGIVNVQVNEYVAIRPELLYSQAGYKYSFYRDFGFLAWEYNETAHWGNIILPVKVVGQYPLNDYIKLQAFVGPYASIVLDGRYEGNGMNVLGYPFEASGKIVPGKKPDNYSGETRYINPWDFGFNFGIGLQAYSFIFSVDYKLGLTDIQPHYSNSTAENNRGTDYTMKNKGVNFSIAYLFGCKK